MSQKVAKAPQFPTTNGYWNNQLPISLTPLSKNIGAQSLPYTAGNTKYMPINNSTTPKHPKPHQINQTSLNNNFLINLNKYSHSNSNKDNKNNNNSMNIIQCPNPTANPIINHRKQEQIAKEQTKHLRNASYMQQMEQKLNEQTQLIQNLMNQNAIFKSQITQQQNYISVIQNQNNLLLNAYNSVKKIPNKQIENNNKLETDYLKWSVNDVIRFISQLENGKFLKYGLAFCLNNIDGKLLINITLEKLNKMGIKNGNDKILLFNHIKKLISMPTNTITNRTNGCEGQIDNKIVNLKKATF